MTAAVIQLTHPIATGVVPPELVGALVERIGANDLAAFDELYRLTRDDVARALLHALGRRADLEAVVAETFARLLDDMRRLRPGAPLLPLLHRTCARVALGHMGLFHRRARCAQLGDESADLMHRALERLAPKTRLVFVYAEMLGLSPEAIAAAVGISLHAVHSRLRRARLELTLALREPEPVVDVEVAL